MLLTTDVAARGLDFADVDWIIQCEVSPLLQEKKNLTSVTRSPGTTCRKIRRCSSTGWEGQHEWAAPEPLSPSSPLLKTPTSVRPFDRLLPTPATFSTLSAVLAAHLPSQTSCETRSRSRPKSDRCPPLSTPPSYRVCAISSPRTGPS